MKNRLFQKIFFSTAVSLLVCLCLVMILTNILANGFLVREKRELLTENCSTIAKVLSSKIDNTTDFHLSMNGIIEVVSGAVGGQAYVSDSKGRVFLCSCNEWKNYKSCDHSNGLISQDILNLASEGSFFEVGHLSGRFQSTYYTAATPIYSKNNTIVGFVYISSPASLLRALSSDLLKIYVLCIAIPMLLLFVFLFFMTRKITRPINLMSEAAVNMSKGDFSKQIPVDGDDEISNLANAFNNMSKSLAQLEGMRRSFVANVSHELRTPMTTIGGFIDGILDGTIPENKKDYYLNIVSTEIKRLSRLVHSMLSLAKLESGEQKVNLSRFEFNDLIFEVLVSQEQRIEAGDIQITGLDSGKDILVNADRDLIYQMVYNLTDNAIKFTPNGKKIEFSVQRQVDGLHFNIRNEGKGIRPEELQYIFDRFYKTDKSRSSNKDGIGLGLYIVKTIAEIHGGKVTVTSKFGEFTEFEVLLPNA